MAMLALLSGVGFIGFAFGMAYGCTSTEREMRRKYGL
jgi:hypothetical protein